MNPTRENIYNMGACDKVVIGNAELYCGDCREILPALDVVDLVLTDPPYGIGEAAGKNKSRGVLAAPTDYCNDDWDSSPPTKDEISVVVDAGKLAVLFGGNYFDVPPTSCFLVWDKDNGANDFADCELAWTNYKCAVRLKKYRWHGMLQEKAGRNKEKRYHPTQKPVPVMEWVISLATSPVESVLDPYMGVGTTGVACANMGLLFVGIERERKYFDVACERIAAAQSQGKLAL